MEQEVWKPIAGYNGIYEASNLGRVKSHKGNIKRVRKRKAFSLKEIILTPRIGKTNGYAAVSLNNKKKNIHRLVAETFIPNPENKSDVNHKNCIKTDNRVENLEWATRKENNDHAYFNGLIKGGVDCNFNKLTEQQVLEIYDKYKNKKEYYIDIAKEYNITKTHVTAIGRKETWRKLLQNI